MPLAHVINKYIAGDIIPRGNFAINVKQGSVKECLYCTATKAPVSHGASKYLIEISTVLSASVTMYSPHTSDDLSSVFAIFLYE